MTSTKSLNKNFFALFGDTVRRYKVWPILSAVLSFLATVAMCQSEFKSIAFIGNTYTQYFTSIFAYIYFAGISFLLFLATLNLFKPIYSKRASDFYFAVPVTRKTKVFVNYCFTSFCAFIGFVIGTVVPILWYFSMDSKGKGNFDLKYFATKMILMFVAILAVLAILILCAVSSGRKWQYILSSAVILYGLSYIPCSIVTFIKQSFVCLHISMPKIAYMFSPISVVIYSDVAEVRYRYFLIALAAIIAISLIMSVAIFNRRKVECAEQSYASKTMFVISVAICTVVTFMQIIAMSDENKGVQIAGIVIAFIIGYIISMILQKKFFTKTSIITVSVATAFIAALYFVIIGCAANVDYKTVNLDEVDSVSFTIVDNDYPSVSMFYSDAFDSYDTDEYAPMSKDTTYSFKETDSVNAVTGYYNKLSLTTYSYTSNLVRFTFKLKNGKTIVREYGVDSYNDGQESSKAAIISLPEFVKQKDFYKLNRSKIIAMGVYVSSNYEEENLLSSSTDEKKIASICDLVKKDMTGISSYTEKNGYYAVDDNGEYVKYYGVKNGTIFYSVKAFCKSKRATAEDVTKFEEALAANKSDVMDEYIDSGKIIVVEQDVTEKCYKTVTDYIKN